MTVRRAHERPEGRLALVAGLLLAGLAAGGARALAQQGPAPGSFRGHAVILEDARSTPAGADQPASGTARWRLELDSLDWRYKPTLRITLARPDTAALVIRITRPVLVSRLAPQRYTASLYVRERGAPQVYDQWFSHRDTVLIESEPPLSRASVLRGRLLVQGYRDSVPGRSVGPKMTRRIVGEFTATFDPRPDPYPPTMTDSLQEAILRRALWDAGLQWLESKVHIDPTDSTHETRKLRPYLESRWSGAATIDSASTDLYHFYIRMRGRHAPITCIHTEEVHPTCYSTRYWWSRIFRR